MDKNQMVAAVFCMAIIATAFLVTVRLSQAYYLRTRTIEAELEKARLQEKMVNGRGSDDLADQAKQLERIARARDKEAKALEAEESGDG